jgi:hypothetical protein
MRGERRSSAPPGTMWCYNHMGVQAVTICPVCLRALCEACASRMSDDGVCDNCARRQTTPVPIESTAATAPKPGACYQHEFTPASVFCARCGRAMCRGCARPVRGLFACSDCVHELEHESRPPTKAEWVAVGLLVLGLILAYAVLRSAGIV